LSPPVSLLVQQQPSGASAVLRPAYYLQTARPATRRGVGEVSGGAGDSRVRGGAGGGPQAKWPSISYTHFCIKEVWGKQGEGTRLIFLQDIMGFDRVRLYHKPLDRDTTVDHDGV